jgi:hypothetical protein
MHLSQSHHGRIRTGAYAHGPRGSMHPPFNRNRDRSRDRDCVILLVNAFNVTPG